VPGSERLEYQITQVGETLGDISQEPE
jgi:hypothetical protein